FTLVTTGELPADSGGAQCAAWADFNNDSFLDLFVGYSDNGRRALYRNKGDGTFARIEVGNASDRGDSIGASWSDYDNDGNLDLFVTGGDSPNFFYRNDGNGSFTKINSRVFANVPSSVSVGVAWGDYD